jgi:hypothetical protein
MCELGFLRFAEQVRSNENEAESAVVVVVVVVLCVRGLKKRAWKYLKMHRAHLSHEDLRQEATE